MGFSPGSDGILCSTRGQGDDCDAEKPTKRLNVLEMMKEFRTNMDISDELELEEQHIDDIKPNESTEQPTSTEEVKPVSPDHKETASASNDSVSDYISCGCVL